MGREVQGASELGVAGSGMLPTQQEQRLLAQLEQLLALRHKGASAQAKTLLQKLEHDYPQVDIEARLQQLQSPP